MEFKTLIDVQKAFSSEAVCIEYFEAIRWPDGKVVSPFDPASKVYKCKNYRYKCRNTNKYFNVRTGTIFENTNIPMSKWFLAMYLMTSHSKGISSVQLSKDLGITQKSAWFILHRLRHAIDQDAFWQPIETIAEADETYIHGKEKNRHASTRNFKQGQGAIGRADAPNKKVVFGVVERKGGVYVKHIPNANKQNIDPHLHKAVKPGSRLITDEWYAYHDAKTIYNHETIRHSSKQYVLGDVHTNTIENFWSVLKRGVYGIYHQISQKHTQKYLDEFSFRYNLRYNTVSDKFVSLLSQSGRRLTYETLIQKGKTKKAD